MYEQLNFQCRQYASRKTKELPNLIAILTTFFCCQVKGVVSIVYAARVNAKWDGGDYAGAQEDSKNAKLWGLIGLIGGGILLLFIIIAYGALIAGAIANGDFN